MTSTNQGSPPPPMQSAHNQFAHSQMRAATMQHVNSGTQRSPLRNYNCDTLDQPDQHMHLNYAGVKRTRPTRSDSNEMRPQQSTHGNQHNPHRPLGAPSERMMNINGIVLSAEQVKQIQSISLDPNSKHVNNNVSRPGSQQAQRSPSPQRPRPTADSKTRVARNGREYQLVECPHKCIDLEGYVTLNRHYWSFCCNCGEKVKQDPVPGKPENRLDQSGLKPPCVPCWPPAVDEHERLTKWIIQTPQVTLSEPPNWFVEIWNDPKSVSSSILYNCSRAPPWLKRLRANFKGDIPPHLQPAFVLGPDNKIHADLDSVSRPSDTEYYDGTYVPKNDGDIDKPPKSAVQTAPKPSPFVTKIDLPEPSSPFVFGNNTFARDRSPSPCPFEQKAMPSGPEHFSIATDRSHAPAKTIHEDAESDKMSDIHCPPTSPTFTNHTLPVSVGDCLAPNEHAPSHFANRLFIAISFQDCNTVTLRDVFDHSVHSCTMNMLRPPHMGQCVKFATNLAPNAVIDSMREQLDQQITAFSDSADEGNDDAIASAQNELNTYAQQFCTLQSISSLCDNVGTKASKLVTQGTSKLAKLMFPDSHESDYNKFLTLLERIQMAPQDRVSIAQILAPSADVGKLNSLAENTASPIQQDIKHVQATPTFEYRLGVPCYTYILPSQKVLC